MSEWDHRQLCSDGACVGVIGPEGTCKVCGRVAPNWGDERKRGLLEPEQEPEAKQRLGKPKPDKTATGGALYFDIDADGKEVPDQGPSVPSDRDWDQRTLCPDEACIGLIGRNGKCKVCGKSAPGAAGTPDAETEAETDAEDEDEDDEDDEDGEYEDDDEDGEYEDDDDDDDDEADAEDDDDGKIAAEAPSSTDPDWNQRRLCPDDACIGVIGANGMCKVCGRRAE
jgi:hypothetical protein